MLSNGDYLTETIAHFIGQFEVAVEQARMRQDFERFNHETQAAADRQLDGAEPVAFVAADVAVGFQPDADWVAPPTGSDIDYGIDLFHLDPPIIDIPDFLPALDGHHPMRMGSLGSEVGPMLGAPPPSVVMVVQQHKFLFDNDVIVVGDYDGPLPFTQIDTVAELDALSAKASAVTGPYSSIPLEMNQAGVVPWVTATMQAASEAESPTASGAELSGVWVNGEVKDAAPELIDHLPPAWQQEPEPEEPGSDPIIIDASEQETVMEIEAGGNLSVNQATIVDAGLSGTTLAVAGNTYEMDVIVQVNVLRDLDTVDSGFVLPQQDELETIAVNVAQFVRETKDAAADRAEANPDLMPQNWQITTVEGDMIFFEWIYQYNFTSDSDCLALTAMGTTTTISTGGNAGFNGVSFADLGAMYDLILIGGSLYDANYICQTNIIYDNDTLSMMTAMAGQSGSVSTGGNMLWNQASIENVGPAGWVQGMPQHYRDAMDGIDDGDYDMPWGFRSDASFEGYGNLNVLYIKGNVFDINYIEQTNVIADADQVAMYAQEAEKSAQWQISTGGNAAVNAAGIIDYDSNGAICYVDGQSYSQAMLIQANIIETDDDYLPGNNQPLASEVIAFLTDDIAAPNELSEYETITAPTYGPTPDVMDSVLA
jgi:hypothetical protein